MVIIFIGLLVFSIAAAVMFTLDDHSLIFKGFIWLIVLSSVALRFVPELNEAVHFLVPIFMQLFVCGAAYFSRLMD